MTQAASLDPSSLDGTPRVPSNAKNHPDDNALVDFDDTTAWGHPNLELSPRALRAQQRVLLTLSRVLFVLRCVFTVVAFAMCFALLIRGNFENAIITDYSRNSCVLVGRTGDILPGEDFRPGWPICGIDQKSWGCVNW